jgi:hypothetical protein
MPADPTISAPISAPPDRAATMRRPADFALLAKRIAGRTTDLIVIGIVLIGGLSMGRQVIEWWREDPAAIGAADAAIGGNALWGDQNAPLELEFGNYPLTLRRESVAGNRDTALGRLVEVCRNVVQTARPNEEKKGISPETLLAKIGDRRPVAEKAGQWQVYQLDEGFPLVLGIRITPSTTGPHAGAARHLVCWGLAAPLGEEGWTLYTFVPSAAGPATQGKLPDVPLPASCRQLLVLRSQGGQLIGFCGSGSPDDLAADFDESFQTLGWSADGGWANGRSNWAAHYRPSGKGQSGRIEVVYSRSDAGELRGLVQIAP